MLRPRIGFRLTRRAKKWVVGSLLAGTALFVGLALLPGEIEGVYDTFAFQCACDSKDYFELREGRMIFHSTGHPPSEIYGTYTRFADGRYEIRLLPDKGKSEGVLFASVRSYLLVSHFRSPGDQSGEWCLKRPKFGGVKALISTNKIRQRDWVEAGLRDTIYDHDFRIVESKVIPKKKKQPQ